METTLSMIIFLQTDPDFINLIKIRFCLYEISPCRSLCVTQQGKNLAINGTLIITVNRLNDLTFGSALNFFHMGFICQAI